MQVKIAIALHIIAVFILLIDQSSLNRPIAHKVAIHVTRQATQKVATKSQSSLKQTPKPKTQAPSKQTPSQVKPPVAKQAAKPPAKKPTVSTPVPKPSKPSQLKSEPPKETIAKIEEKIDKLEQIIKGATKQSHLEPQVLPEDSIIDSQQSPISGVIEYLFELLELPGPGKVTVEILITRDGKVDKVEIIDSENVDNSMYLKDHLLNLVLPFDLKNQIPSSLKICFSNLKS